MAESNAGAPPDRRGSQGENVVVSVLIPVLNEARMIPRTAPAMLEQRLDAGIEFLFLDGGSEDGTRSILDELARADPRVRVLHNLARRQAPALNLGLAHARGDFVARMDAHAFYPRDYLALGTERLRRGGVAWVGGPQLASGEDNGSRRVALALTSRLGVGGAAFRRMPREEIETDTSFTGILRRSTLEGVGGWDERWSVNEDGELAARVKAAGGRIVCIPEMAARYVPRSTLGALARQYWRYGWDRAMTSRRHPETMRRSHLLPPGLVLAALAGGLAPRSLARPARALLLAYALCVGAESVRRAERAADALALPSVFGTMHLLWGCGFHANCVREGIPLAGVAGAVRSARRP